jgi:hypothetical protein
MTFVFSSDEEDANNRTIESFRPALIEQKDLPPPDEE